MTAITGHVRSRAVAAAVLVAVASLAMPGAMAVAASASPMVPPASPQASGPASAGERFEYQVVAGAGESVSPDLMAKVRDIITARMVSYGVAGTAALEGTDRVVVELPADPSGTDWAELRELITTTGRLDFIGVPDEFANLIVEGDPLPQGMDATPLFSGDQVASAAVGSDQVGKVAIDLVFTDAAATLFDDYAAGHLGQRFAIVLDGRVLSAPVLQATHYGGRAQISGNYTAQTANDMVTLLDFGALPLDVVDIAPAQ